VGADGDATASESYRPTVNPTREDPGDLSTTDEENTTALEATNASSVTITSGGSSIIS